MSSRKAAKRVHGFRCVQVAHARIHLWLQVCFDGSDIQQFWINTSAELEFQEMHPLMPRTGLTVLPDRRLIAMNNGGAVELFDLTKPAMPEKLWGESPKIAFGARLYM